MKLCFGLALAILLTANAYGTDNTSKENEITESNDDTSQREDNESKNENLIELSEITHYTKEFDVIDISISRESYVETCFVQPPDSDMIPMSQLSIEHVTVQFTTNFVACRISIGPMNSHLLGDWKVCAVADDGKTRCQPAKIVWNNAAFPSAGWNVHRGFTVNHPVHFVSTVNTGIAESSRYAGRIETCHIITPNGEDLVLNADTTYPHIRRTELDNHLLCAVIIDINAYYQTGNWVIYARFRAGDTQTEIRQPMTFYIYNPENQYEQSYNVTDRTEKNEVTLGDTYNAKLSGSGEVKECFYIMPSGERYSLLEAELNKEVTLKSLEDEVACELTIDAVTNEMLGSWQFISKFNNENLFDEKQLHFTLYKEDTIIESEESEEEDEVEQEDENVKLLSDISHSTGQQAMIDISLNKESFEEDCYIQAPNGETIKATELNMAGVEVQAPSIFVSCRITIGPMTANLLGNWRLCGKSVTTEEMRCQPATIAWNSNNGIANWDTTPRERFEHPVHFGGAVNPGVAGNGVITTCHVVTPAGEDLVLTTDVQYPHIERSALETPNLCSVIIKEIARDLLGDWIIYGRFRSILGQNEFRLPITLFLYDENNPYSQAYNVTELSDEQHLINVGTNITLQVSQTVGAVEDCIYTIPSGEVFNQNKLPSNEIEGVTFKNSDSAALCQVTLEPITETTTGEWRITGRFRNGDLFNELHQSFKIIKEDPANPIVEDIDRTVQVLPTQVFNTQLKASHRIVIARNNLIENESCHIITADGLQYAFIPGFNVPGIEIINEAGVECGVLVNIESYDMIGEWTLLARATWTGVPIERRQPFSIQVEENFVIRHGITITEGADLYLHLDDLPRLLDTCKLYGPDGNNYTEAEIDPLYRSRCGYIVRNVSQNHTGTWIIEYGDKKKYRGSVNVVVFDYNEVSIDNLHWYTGDSVNTFLGPEDAVYCKIVDPRGVILFDGFGRCKIVVNRLTLEHRGTWKMFIATPGTVLMKEYGFYVNVQARASRTVVTTSIERISPSVMLTCSIPIEHDVQACKFRDPAGNILVAAHSVGEGGYMFNGSSVYYQSQAHSHDCTLRLTNPSVMDLGIWRCAMDTSTDTYYGFLTLICPHLMQNPEVAASIVTEPVLKAETSLTYLNDEPAVLRCTIPAPLRYCYFRSRNGSVYNVFPGMSTSQNFKYVGAGLDAGDCGIQFNSLSTQESGRWSCHVGLENSTAVEQFAEVEAEIRAKLSVRHYWHRSSSMLIVEAVVYGGRPIDYCRFVKINGQGFTSDNVPRGYEILDGLHNGYCTLYIRNPNMIDAHPWSVAVKLTGQDGEFSTTTTENLLAFFMRPNIFGEVLFWLLIIFICIIPLMAASALVPKKNREWTYRRASRIRTSFRNSWNNTFKKKPAIQQGA